MSDTTSDAKDSIEKDQIIQMVKFCLLHFYPEIEVEIKPLEEVLLQVYDPTLFDLLSQNRNDNNKDRFIAVMINVEPMTPYLYKPLYEIELSQHYETGMSHQGALNYDILHPFLAYLFYDDRPRDRNIIPINFFRNLQNALLQDRKTREESKFGHFVNAALDFFSIRKKLYYLLPPSIAYDFMIRPRPHDTYDAGYYLSFWGNNEDLKVVHDVLLKTGIEKKSRDDEIYAIADLVNNISVLFPPEAPPPPAPDAILFAHKPKKAEPNTDAEEVTLDKGDKKTNVDNSSAPKSPDQESSPKEETTSKSSKSKIPPKISIENEGEEENVRNETNKNRPRSPSKKT